MKFFGFSLIVSAAIMAVYILSLYDVASGRNAGVAVFLGLIVPLVVAGAGAWLISADKPRR